MLKLMSSASQSATGDKDPLGDYVHLLINVDGTDPNSIYNKKQDATVVFSGASYDPTGDAGILMPGSYGPWMKVTDVPPIDGWFSLDLYQPWSIDVKFTMPDATRRLDLFKQTQWSEWRAGTTQLYYENGFVWFHFEATTRYYYHHTARTPLTLTPGVNEISVERQNRTNFHSEYQVYHNGQRLQDLTRYTYDTPYDYTKNLPLIPVNGEYYVVGGHNSKIHNYRVTSGAIRYGGNSYASAPGAYPL